MRIWILAGIAVLFGILFAAGAHGTPQGEEPPLLGDAVDPVLPEPPPPAEIANYRGSAHQPQTMFDGGPDTWSYVQLTPKEQAVIDKNRGETEKWSQTHAAYATQMHRIAADTAARSAENRLGLANMATVGVVP